MSEDIKYRFFVTTQAGEREIFPQNTNSLTITWAKDKNSAFFRKQLGGKIKIVGEDFHYVYDQERSIYRCTQIPFVINKNCGGFTEYFTGQILCDDGTWNISNCEVEIQANVLDPYACYDDNKNTVFNLFGVTAHDEHVNTVRGTIEKVTYRDTHYPPADWGGSGDPIAQGWIIIYKTETWDVVVTTPPTVDQAVTWIRELYTSDHVLGAPWILLSTDTSDPFITFYNYARQPAIFGETISRTQISDTAYTTVTQWKYGAKFQNGMKLYGALSGLLFDICPLLTIKSDFFQWNPDNETDINYETGDASKILNLILFQKSDVKRPPTQSDIDAGFAADDAATIANTDFDSLLQDILTTFKCQFWIDDDDHLRIEHPSYFNKVLGLDLTVPRDDTKYRVGSAIYSYVTDGLPKREIFSWMDKASAGDFAGQDIVYQSTCSGISDANNKTISVQNITTDVELCLDNPAEDSDVSDEGFCLMACDEANDLLYEAPILPGSHTLNNTLSWAHLQFDYFRYNNYFKNFTLNNNDEETQKLLPNKKQTGIIAVICCGEDFDPDKLVKTVIGTGEVNSATLNLYTDQLTLEVLFEQNKDLTSNNPPVAIGANERTPLNTDITIDVLSRATDSDGTIVPATLAIVGVTGGTAVITVDYKITFTPTADFIGNGSVSWTVEDDFSQTSNVALDVIQVYQPAIASDDAYRIAKNKTLNKPGYNLLTNDTGTGTLQCIAESKATDNGHVVISTNGTFVYTPNTGFIGDDHFQYTLIDINNDTDLGDVTITVFETVPVFVKLVKGPNINHDIIDVCYPVGQTVTGNQINNDFTIFFYSDMAGTIPLDTTGYEDIIHINQYTITNGVRVDSVRDVPTGGTSVFIGNFATYERDNGCSGTMNFLRTFDMTGFVASSDYTGI